jgi:superfamily II DNA or RNA helicase
MTAAVTPRPHQAQALADLMTAFAIHERVRLIMACGTGKTLVGRWHAQASDARNILVLVPSLALLAQTLHEWRRADGWAFDALVICSDPTTEAGAAERDDQVRIAPTEWLAAKAKVTTDPAQAARFLEAGRGARRVVFSTYHSAPVVVAAQARTGSVFDLAICDEAHRLAGSPRAEFRVVLDSRQIVARRRLFMTATERLVGDGDGFSMDDVDLFGPVAHKVSFGEAIRVGLLCDYQVTVLGIPGTVGVDDPASAAPAAVLDAVDRHQVSRLVTFHSRVQRAADFAKLLNGTCTPSGRRVEALHLSGSMPTSRRNAGLAWLGAPTADHEVRLVSNARVLTEGVDVPAVDGICFVDPRASVIDIIQAIGRVLRPAPGKKIGTIIVPIGLPAHGDDDTELLVSRFGLLWTVLRALRSHDQRFADELDLAARAAVLRGDRNWGYRPDRLAYVLPDWISEDLLHLRLVQQLGEAWERFFAATWSWAVAHPGRRLPRNTSWQGYGVGEWAAKQRAAHANGVLPTDRATKLAEMPGWYWDRTDIGWDDTYAQLVEMATSRGTIAENAIEPSAFAGVLTASMPREQLGVWLAKQRQQYRAGRLDPGRVEQLEALPGWTWTPVAVEDLEMVDALRRFCALERHSQVPEGHFEDGLPLGRWVWKVRRRKLAGNLPPALEDEIWAATPSRWARGENVRWQWEKAETQWRVALAALRAFTRREGHASPSGGHVETLPDQSVGLGQWVALQRHLANKGELSDRRRAVLEELPGWQWEGRGRRLDAEPPIELPSHLHHGGAGAIARGCHCKECLTARRETTNKSKQKTRAAAIRRPVSAARTHRHLIALEARLRPMLLDGDS